AVAQDGGAADDPVTKMLMADAGRTRLGARDRPADGRELRVRDVDGPALTRRCERRVQLADRRARAHRAHKIRGRVLDDAAQRGEIDSDVVARRRLSDRDARATAPEHNGLVRVVRTLYRGGEVL